MAKRLQLRRGTTTEHGSFTGAVGEVTVDTTKDTVVVHDNSTAGGTPLATESDLTTKPHIIPDVLYPAVAGKLLDGSTALSAVTTGPNGSTVASSKYGTVQSDGRMYYYTDIKGSKPIKDPRIGAHFGSQRHKTKHFNLLEQETATHGDDVYSIDGREWMRAVGTWIKNNYNSAGQYHYVDSGVATNASFVEITGYFSDINWIGYVNTVRDVNISVDGGNVSTNTAMTASVVTPLAGRYVDAGSLVNLGLSQTLGIHTLKIANVNGDYFGGIFAIELIAQDTTSATNKSKIQIPSQNVVSYGKKFTVSGTPHYNPFAYAGDGTTAVAIGNTSSHGKVADGWTGSTSAYFDSTLDTATSLGLSAWETGGDFYRPVNGGRVVRWVDSSGNIKTSVNMMPPAATSISSSLNQSNSPTGSDWTTTYLPKITGSGTIDHSQAEVAKTFNWREFGNGNANGGATGTWKDASMLDDTDRDIAYVMDDGLTSLSGKSLLEAGEHSILPKNSGTAEWYVTFIGTGVTINTKNYGEGTYHIAQNLPYGTHVLKGVRDNANGSSLPDYTIDGIAINDVAGGTYASISDITFHQPKMPPIPQDAVIVADFMLMADHVVRTADGVEKISKGVRTVYATRDVFYDAAGAFNAPTLDPRQAGGYYIHRDTESTVLSRITAFSTNAIKLTYNAEARYQAWYTNDTAHSSADTTTKNGAAYGSYYHPTAATTLGQNIYDQYGAGVSALQTAGYEIVSPIHTSSHYQTFETPFLHELVGGDRNMEQTNLVVTPDGKTWDEVTRDVSYIGNQRVVTTTDSTFGSGTQVIFDEWRGNPGGSPTVKFDTYNKDWAIARDKLICLKDGAYQLSASTISNTENDYVVRLLINGSLVTQLYKSPSHYTIGSWTVNHIFKRGDYVELYGVWFGSTSYGRFTINRI